MRATFYVNPPNVALRPDAWRRMVAAGHEIGNHTMTHPCSGHFPWSRRNALEDFDLARMARELDDANAWIRAQLGVTPRSFGYPCNQSYVGRGRTLSSYVPLVAERFVCGRGALESPDPADPAFVDLAQVPCLGSDGRSFADLAGAVTRAAEAGGWVVFCGHEIGDGGYQTTLAAELDRLCGWLREHAADLWVAPVADVAAHLAAGR